MHPILARARRTLSEEWANARAAVWAADRAEMAMRKRVAELRARVQAVLRWDENKHPRVPAGSGDPSGQFTSGGDGGSEQDAPPNKKAWITEKAHAVAKSLGFPTERVHVSDKVHKFEVNGQHYTAGGVAMTTADWTIDGEKYKKGDIVLFAPPGFTKDIPVRGVTAHEIMHQKFQTVLDRVEEESRVGWDSFSTDPDNPHFTFGGEVKPEFADKYPTYAKINPLINNSDNLKKLKTDDGVTSYSRAYWDAWKVGKGGNYMVAIHETLAEIAKLQEEEVLIPKYVSKEWVQLYKAVNSEYKRISRRDRKN